MTDTPNRPPLWKVLHQAHLEEAGMVRYIIGSEPVLGEPDRFTRAAEIRAVAEWIKKARPDYDEVLHGAIRADELDSILALLTAEADRAEKGDG